MNRLLKAGLILISLTGIPYAVYLILYLLKDPNRTPAKKATAEPAVSIVLPTYNEEAIIQSKLEELVSLDYPSEQIEIIVVDSSDDRTPEIVQEFFQSREAPKLEFIREPERRGLAVALNQAYAASNNSIVIKTDCDSRIADDALRLAVENLADNSVGAVTGRNAEILGGSEVERGYRDVQATIQVLESHLDSTLIFHGPFSAFKRELIVPIDEDSIADDTELALKIRKQGKRVVFDPAIKYKEAAHSEFSKRRQQKDRRAMGLIRLLWRQRDMLGRYGNYGRIVLPFNWWFMIVSPWLLLGGIITVSVGSVLATGPFGLTMPFSVVIFMTLGARDALGKYQPLYSLFDTQVSLAHALVALLRGKGDGTWDIDDELREVFEK